MMVSKKTALVIILFIALSLCLIYLPDSSLFSLLHTANSSYVYMHYILNLISDDGIKENGFSDHSVHCIISVCHLSPGLIPLLGRDTFSRENDSLRDLPRRFERNSFQRG